MKKRVRNGEWLFLMALAIACCLIGTVASGEETGSGDSVLNNSQTLLAAVTIDHEGVEMIDTSMVVRKDPEVSVGFGLAGVPDYEGSEDYEARPLLFARADWTSGRYVEFLGARLRANVLASDTWSFGPTLRYRSKRDDDVDSDRVARMREVDASVEAGTFVGFEAGNCHASLQATQDVADGHDGLLVRLDAGYRVPLEEPFRLGITIFTTYADDDYMGAYFGVDADNAARSGLSIYDADSGIKDVGFTVTLGYRPWANWGVTTIAGYTRLLGDAKDSPVVDVEGDETQYVLGLMATYRF